MRAEDLQEEEEEENGLFLGVSETAKVRNCALCERQRNYDIWIEQVSE